MSEIVTAVYEKGVLRPLKPLNLHERETVRIQLLPLEIGDRIADVVRLLVSTGLLTPPPGHSNVEPLSEEEQRALADRLGEASGRPLSELIIEERGEWG